MKKWLRNKLRVLLEVDKLEEKLITETGKLKHRNYELLKELDDLREHISNIASQFNIAADISHIDNHSWAVISIAGKPEYVRFVNLSNRDMREVQRFLQQFEGCNRAVDSPLPLLKESKHVRF